MWWMSENREKSSEWWGGLEGYEKVTIWCKSYKQIKEKTNQTERWQKYVLLIKSRCWRCTRKLMDGQSRSKTEKKTGRKRHGGTDEQMIGRAEIDSKLSPPTVREINSIASPTPLSCSSASSIALGSISYHFFSSYAAGCWLTVAKAGASRLYALTVTACFHHKSVSQNSLFENLYIYCLILERQF